MKKSIINFIGMFFIIMCIAMLLPLGVAFYYNEKNLIWAFGKTIISLLIIGIILVFLSRKLPDKKLHIKDSYFIVTISWLIASAAGAVPFVLSGALQSPIDAFFEMSSGFSTTGASIVTNVEALPKSLIFWRSFSQWLGGMGIIVLLAALLPSFGIKAKNIASAEIPGPSMSNLTSRFSGTAQRLYIAYIILTIAQIIFLMLGSLNLFDASAHAFSTMATGGFSTYNDGISHFNSLYVDWVIIIFMFLAGTNFFLYFSALKNGFKKTFCDEEWRTYLYIVIFASLITIISLLHHGFYKNIGKCITDAFFQVVTIITTTGFASANFVKWPALCQMILVLLMITGASSSSTSGGIKIVRIITIFKLIKRELKLKIHDNIIENVKYNKVQIPSDIIKYIIAFVTSYITIIIIGTLLVSIRSHGDLVTDFTAVLSCISNVGPGLNNVGPESNYSFYSPFGTFVLSLIMIAGRLELSTFVIVFFKYFRNSNKAF